MINRQFFFLIKKPEDVGTKHFNDSKALIECSRDIMMLNKVTKLKDVKY